MTEHNLEIHFHMFCHVCKNVIISDFSLLSSCIICLVSSNSVLITLTIKNKFSSSFLSSPLEHSYTLCVCVFNRVTVQRGLSFSTVRPSDALLWDITVNAENQGETQTVLVTCQRKSTITAKRQDFSLLVTVFTH